MRRLSILGITLLIVLMGAHALAWRWATGRVTSETLAWADAQRAQGWTVDFTPPEPEGWPFDVHVRLAGFTLGGAVSRQPAGTYQADALIVGVSLFHPHRLTVNAEGHQHVRLGAGPVVDIDAAHTGLAFPIADNTAPDTADLIASDLHATTAAGSTRNLAPLPMSFEFHDIHLHVEGLTGPLQRLTLQTTDIGLPANTILAALGSRIAGIALDGSITLPCADPAAWRAAGGVATITRLSLDWGRLSVIGDGVFSLDAGLQPEGSGHVHLVGTDQTLDALSGAGALPQRSANAAKAILALLSRPQETGPPAVDMPFAIRDRTLRIGNFPIARMPEAVW